jgi:hypothetical protein
MVVGSGISRVLSNNNGFRSGPSRVVITAIELRHVARLSGWRPPFARIRSSIRILKGVGSKSAPAVGLGPGEIHWDIATFIARKNAADG